MLAIVIASSILGFVVSSGPQKTFGFLGGWMVGITVAGVVGYPRLSELRRVLADFAFTLFLIAGLSFTVFWVIRDGEHSSVDALLIVIGSATLAVGLPFACFSFAGWLYRAGGQHQEDDGSIE